MFSKAKKVFQQLHREETGSYMVEMALVLIGVALATFMAASNLSSGGIVPKYDAIRTEITNVAIPDLTP